MSEFLKNIMVKPYRGTHNSRGILREGSQKEKPTSFKGFECCQDHILRFMIA